MIRFDPHTLTSWKQDGISDISCIVTNTGCAGHKIRIEVGITEGLDALIETEGLRIHTSHSYKDLLNTAYISRVGENWILSSTSVNTRCGCGKSFSFKTGDRAKDKIEEMRLRLRQKKEGAIHK